MPQGRPTCRGVYKPARRDNNRHGHDGHNAIHPLRGVESNNIADIVPFKLVNYKPVCRGNYKPNRLYNNNADINKNIYTSLTYGNNKDFYRNNF